MTKPKRLGKYEIIEGIGRGGFAVVYKARDTELDRIVALKVLHPQHTIDPKFIQRFRQEAQTAARLHHPHIVTIHEVGEEAGQHYIAMAFLPGRTLDKVVGGKPLSTDRAISIIEQAADALDAIHEQGLVHRDVKPANVMVDETDQATLLDFGIVRAAEGTRLTTTMTTLGTPEYMAPEQAEIAEGTAGIDWRADVYALGAVAYETLVGRPPFTGRSPTAILHKHVYEQPPAPCTLNPDLPKEIEPVLLKALAKGREERFQRAGDFAAELRRAYVAESQIREQEAQIAPLYRRLQSAAAEEDWAEVLALGGRIQALDPAYRDVSGRMEQARRELRRLRRRPVPAWAWGVGGVAVLGVIVLLVVFGSRWNEWFAQGPINPPPPTLVLTPGDTWVRPADEMVMVYVPAGEFEMGSTEGDDDEQPVHTVVLDAFWIDRTEVSNAQYALCVGDGVCDEAGFVNDVDLSGDDYPVVGVFWYDANTYCSWVDARLPTEAEWEYAARGPEGHTYPWGNEDPTCDLAQYYGCSGGTVPVGSLPDGASWCGALDLAGNVWEWVADWYGDYPSGALTNPTGPEMGVFRVLRGGSWDVAPVYLRSAPRLRLHRAYRGDDGGFRCARGSE